MIVVFFVHYRSVLFATAAEQLLVQQERQVGEAMLALSQSD
jgi:hypothetical protein